MLEQLEHTLRELALIPALSGHEQKMTAHMKNAFEAMGLPTHIDTVGNCIARLEGTDPDAPKIMLFSHMDSLGFVVRKIEDDGFLRIERLGGIPEKVLPATQVQVQRRDGGMVDGVIGVKAHHVTPPEEKYIVDKLATLYVDIGAKSRDEVLQLGITVGAPIVYLPKFRKLLGSRVLLSTSDDRSGCACILEVARRMVKNPPESTVYFVGSVQEEYNLRGAMLAARAIQPQIALCLDGGGGADTPDLKGMGEVRVGGGPVLCMYNFHGRGTLNGTIPHPAIVRIVESAAQRAGIAVQRKAQIGSLTDLSYVQLEGTGVMGMDISFPGRYTHSPCEIVDLCDLVACVKLIEVTVYSIHKDSDFSR